MRRALSRGSACHLALDGCGSPWALRIQDEAACKDQELAGVNALFRAPPGDHWSSKRSDRPPVSFCLDLMRLWSKASIRVVDLPTRPRRRGEAGGTSAERRDREQPAGGGPPPSGQWAQGFGPVDAAGLESAPRRTVPPALWRGAHAAVVITSGPSQARVVRVRVRTRTVERAGRR
jgi:hypothetical protein